MRKLALLFAVALFLSGPSTVSGQVTTGTFYGIVTDRSGGVLAGAEITLTNEATGIADKKLSDDAGEFVFTFVPVGRYTLKIEMVGFKTIESKGIDISAAQSVRQKYQMEIGEISEQVTVSSSATLVDAATTEQRQSVSTEQVVELPLARRNLVALGNLTAGVVATSRSSNNAGTFEVNGLGQGTASITVDGTDASANSSAPQLLMYGGFNTIGAISLEAVEEFQTSKGVISAEYSRTLSGNLNIITKSGTNEWHGSLFENWQGKALNARNQFATSKTPFTFNQFGGSVGGPIIKEKLFIFGVYEGYRESSYQFLQGTVPSARLRSDLIANWPDFQMVLDAFPLPTEIADPNAATGIYRGEASQRSNDNHYVLKSDYWLNQSNRVSATYTHGRPDNIRPSISPQNQRVFEGRSDRLTATYTVLGATRSAETRVGYNRNAVDRLDTFFDLVDPKKAETRPYGRRVPSINALGFDNGNTELMQQGTLPNWSFEQKFSLQAGRHSLKTGAIYFVRQLAGVNLQGPDMRFGSEADLLANLPNRVRVTFGKDEYEASSKDFGLFIQDDWRVTKKLVVNAGIRWDYFSNITAYGVNGGGPHVYNPDGIIDVNTFAIGAFRPVDNPYERDAVNLAPRIGFAYNPDGEGKNVLRVASGIMFSPIVGEVISGTIMNGPDIPFRSQFSKSEAKALGIRFPVYAEDIFPLVTGGVANPSYQIINPNIESPYSINYYLGYQRALSSSMMLETALVANRGVKFQMRRLYNQPDRVTGVRPNPSLSQSVYFDNSESTHYMALQMSLKRRFSHNLAGNVQYTWGKAISYGGGDITDSTSDVQSFHEVRENRGPSKGDVTHRLVIDFIYELPRFEGRTALVRHVLGGWQLAGIPSVRSGAAFDVYQKSSAVEASRPDLVAGVDPINSNYRETLQYLNPAAFVKVPISKPSGASIRPGTLGRNGLRGPGAVNFDMALSKNFRVTERIKFQFRADMFNAFNHTNFSGVDTNLDSGRFGQVSGASARQIQLNGRITF